MGCEEEVARLLRGGDMDDLRTFCRQGLSITEINLLTAFDRKTIRKYLLHPECPRYGAAHATAEQAGATQAVPGGHL